jgi:hypothetical protein
MAMIGSYLGAEEPPGRDSDELGIADGYSVHRILLCCFRLSDTPVRPEGGPFQVVLWR